jgi:serine/threonine protein kinase
MGEVWVARDMVLDVHVALKVLKSQRAAAPIAARRMLQEARTAAQLGHPAICRVFDFGETQVGNPYVVSELMHGETLLDVMETEGRLPAARAVQILLPVVDALAVAHAHGIVHRDVKPDNVFLSQEAAGRTQPKLLDFGIARFVESDTKLTIEGTLLGTPDYMSPEQARGESAADFRTDVWSTCVLLYEAVTGQVPFDGDNYNAVLWSVLHEAPQPIAELGAGDHALWRLLERGLRKDKQERWQAMRELGEALALWLYDHGIREDVCGASLRTTWLEAGLSDVRLELPGSDPPPPPLHPRPSRTSLAPDEVPTLRPVPRTSSPMTLEQSPVASSGQLRWRPRAKLAMGVAALAVGAAATAGLVTSLRSLDAAGPRPATPAESVTRPAPAAAASAVPSSARARRTPAPSAAPFASNASAAPAGSTRAGQRNRRATRRPPPRAKPAFRAPAAYRRDRVKRDFGF